MIDIDEDSLVILLLTSNLLYNNSDSTGNKPLTLNQWNALARRLIDSKLNSPSDLLGKKEMFLINEMSLSEELSKRIVILLSRIELMKQELKKYSALCIKFLTRADKNYPIELRQKLKEQSPPYFCVSGNYENLIHSSIGIVGSRDADEYSIGFTKRLVEKSISEGFSIVSGGAKGIDITSQSHALLLGGKVVSYLHSDLLKTIRKKDIRNYIESGQLTVLSSVHPNARFFASNAMARNKYIYAQSKATFVISSSTKGGTWEGAIENINNQWVPLFVRSDELSPEGNIKLLQLFSDNNIVQRYNISENVGLYDLIKNSLDKSITNMTMNSLDKYNIDVYELILPHLKNLMNEKKSIKEMSSVFKVIEEQVAIWVDRFNKKYSKTIENTNEYKQETLF